MVSDRAPLTETRCLRFDRKYVIQLCVLPVIPYEVSLDRGRLCGTRRIASVFVLVLLRMTAGGVVVVAESRMFETLAKKTPNLGKKMHSMCSQ